MMPAQLGPSQVCFSLTDRSLLTILLVSSARSSVRPDPLHVAPVESLSPLGKKRVMAKMSWILGSWTIVGPVRV